MGQSHKRKKEKKENISLFNCNTVGSVSAFVTDAELHKRSHMKNFGDLSHLFLRMLNSGKRGQARQSDTVQVI